MAEGTQNDSIPDLKEVESKLGMKTPESLLMWMRDAAQRQEDPWNSEWDDVDRVDVDGRANVADSFCHKIRQLKLEMTCLRSADVRILRQLVAVHEGIEAVRWMMEERGALASRSSSLTGSLSSLVTIEGLGPSMSPCRESPSPSSELDPNDTAVGEGCTEGEFDRDNDLSDCAESHFDKLSRESVEETPASPSSASTPGFSTRNGHSHTWSSSSPGTANSLAGATPLKLQDSGAATTTQDFKTSSEPVRKALVRAASSRTARKAMNDPPNQSQAHYGLPKKSPRACKDDLREDEKKAPSREEFLLGYDAQWHWVESQDDVTFL